MVAVVAFAALNRMDTCAQCHVIKDEVVTYKQTAHYDAGVVCQDCHTKPGVFNYFVRNLQGVTHLVNYISDTYQKPITTYVGANNCIQCHPKEEIERDIVVGNIRVNHTGLREEGYQCLTCHANISHPGTQLEVARMPQDTIMSVCARCHDGEQLPDDCDTCHVGGLPSGYEKVADDGPGDAAAVCRLSRRQGVLQRLPPGSADAAPEGLGAGATAGPCSTAASRSASRVTSRTTRGSASTATASRCRTRRIGRRGTTT